MNTTLETALLALVPVCMLLAGSAVLFSSTKTVASFLQLFGAGCLIIVALTHLSEALHLFPSMNWGRSHSIGHYLDFWSAVLGLTLFPFGYLLHSLTKRHF
jgi:zinc transporter ZupT